MLHKYMKQVFPVRMDIDNEISAEARAQAGCRGAVEM